MLAFSYWLRIPGGPEWQPQYASWQRHGCCLATCQTASPTLIEGIRQLRHVVNTMMTPQRTRMLEQVQGCTFRHRLVYGVPS
mmetsp:Transcript_91017/g.235981  ORF Transcript_91017/g.235981 Transcript_91017/m.235981 type:complete len:82 (-) Transcript_91017:150-395(-)